MQGTNRTQIWIRKQQMLLHVTRRHAVPHPHPEPRTRGRFDERLAHLHRAVAVPMLLFDGGTAATRRRFATRARKYLVKCADLGHTERELWWLSYLPGPLRRLGVTLVEKGRAPAP